jgi:hypothetical protein
LGLEPDSSIESWNDVYMIQQMDVKYIFKLFLIPKIFLVDLICSRFNINQYLRK